MSIGSLAAGIGELPEEDEGRIGMDLRPLEANGSVNGLRWTDSVVAAMCICVSSPTRAIFVASVRKEAVV
jgi:hypothetical protein